MADLLRETNILLPDVLDEDTFADNGIFLPGDSNADYGEHVWRGQYYLIQDAGVSNSGYLSFGTSASAAPTSPTSGTGIFIDYSGVYGLNSGTKQFYLQSSNGVAVAGAGAVTLDANGITLTQGSSASNQVKWVSSGSTYVALQTVVGAATTFSLQVDPGSLTTESQFLLTVKGTGTVPSLSLANLTAGTTAQLDGWKNLYWGRAAGNNNILLMGVYDKSVSDTTVGNTITETSLYSKSISANDLASASGLRVRMAGTWLSNTAATRTLTLRFKFGATTITTFTLSLPVAGATGTFEIEVLLFNTATNAQAVFEDARFVRSGAVVDEGISSAGTAAEDTTGAKTFNVTAQWDAASANATLTKKMAIMELLQ